MSGTVSPRVQFPLAPFAGPPRNPSCPEKIYTPGVCSQKAGHDAFEGFLPILLSALLAGEPPPLADVHAELAPAVLQAEA